MANSFDTPKDYIAAATSEMLKFTPVQMSPLSSEVTSLPATFFLDRSCSSFCYQLKIARLSIGHPRYFQISTNLAISYQKQS